MIDLIVLFEMEMEEGVVFPEEPNASGERPECPECGRDWEDGWGEGGVWDYHVHNEGVAVWVRAVCRGCGAVHIFTATGGKSGGGSVRELRDLSRKHSEEFTAWKRRQP
jgi:hypothetical protein